MSSSSSSSDSDDDDSQVESLADTMQHLEVVDMASKRKTSLQKQNALLNHIILPRFLPQSDSTNIHQTELQLFGEMYENIMDLSEIIPPETVALFKSMHKIQHQLSPTNISKEINALQPGNTFAMYIRRQNCTFMVYIPLDEKMVFGKPQNAIVATFPGHLHPNEVYKCDSDIEFTYPQRAIKVKFSQMLCSKEFAHQLCFMYHNLPIESKNRDYVSKWLMTVLCDEDSQIAASFPVITKKLRDELLGDNSKHCFRRSSYYTVIKVLLQHSLTVQMGEVLGEMLYKCLMLKFLTRVCGFYTNQTTFDIDLVAQMIAKMARRIEKLKILFAGATDPYLTDVFDATVQEAIDLIAIIRMKIDEQINEKIALKVELPALVDLNFDRDIKQKMSKLSNYLNTRQAIEQNGINRKYEIKSYERLGETTKWNSNGDALGKRIHWMEFEKLILNGTAVNDNRWNPKELRALFTGYSTYAEAAYKDNPLFISRMILIQLKIIALLDQYACEDYPLLMEHHTGINESIITSLLLPQRIDMKLAAELEHYFAERNQINAIDPSLIGEREPSSMSFARKFARGNATMNRIRDAILQTDSDNLIKKQSEWLACRERVERLRDEAALLSCEFRLSKKKNPVHPGNCKKCALEKSANSAVVTQYERLLPDELAKQYAIVFELCIPEVIAHLRDTLVDFAKYSHGKCNKIKIKSDWATKCVEISRYKQSSRKYVVRLGSTEKRKLKNLHVDHPFDKFNIENKRKCIYYVDKREIPKSIADDAIKAVCTFQAQNEYAGLQWTLCSTNHSQNQVLAQQAKCPNYLSVSEFKHFGSLRSDGHRLQIRNLFAMIETEALSFEKESVLMLIMQSLWECEIKGDADDVREAHLDFSDPIFCNEFIQLLKKFISQQKCNWKHPFKMVMAVLIAVRAFEINTDTAVADEIVGFLNRVRSIVVDWIDKITSTIHEMENPDAKIERDLRLKLIYVGIAGTFTFFIHPGHLHYQRIFDVNSYGRTVVGDDDDDVDDYKYMKGNATAPHLWLLYIITVKNNTLMYTNTESSLPSNLRMFLRLIESIGVHLEPTIKTMIEQNPTTINPLIRKLWTHIDGTTSFSSLEFHAGKYPQIFVAKAMLGETKQRTITIDIIAGIFLVDGFPVGRLPMEIMKNEAYQRFFGNVTFEVQPDASNNYSSVQRYNGYAYEIRKNGQKITITERTANGAEKELIDHAIFEGDFPFLLVNDYSHWLNNATNCIEFRRRTDGQNHFSKETTVHYKLDLKTKYLMHMKTKRWMLDITSKSYKNISHQLARLEHCNYIHISTHKDTPGEAMVELVRMNLKFKVDTSKAEDHQEFHLESNEFSGMQVSQQQNVGTLYGLKHGLILEGAENAENRILLIPHGDIHCERTESHVTVHIDTKSELRSPSFFQYKIDEFCRQIKSNNRDYASWFYLAYLHAVTSHGQIERFTGQSGTERSIQILQSAYAWSSAPYEATATKILEKIAKLSPCRQLDENRQIVVWPKHIQPHAAQDCFVFIAQKLFADSQRLHGLYFKEKAETFKKLKTSLDLNARDHRRCQQLNPNLNVLDTFIEHKELCTSLPDQISAPSFSKQTQKVSLLYHRRQYDVPSSLDLKSLLMNKEQLIGVAGNGCIKNILTHCMYDSFDDLWIRLYNAVRYQQFNNEQLTLILTVYAHRDVSINLILALQAIAMNPNAFAEIDPPQIDLYEPLNGICVDSMAVSELLRKSYKKPTQYNNKEWKEIARKQEHNSQLQNIIKEVIEAVKNAWPCNSISLIGRWKFPYIDFIKAEKELNEMLLSWNNNQKLDLFIDEVEECLRSLPTSGEYLKFPKYFPRKISPLNSPKAEIDCSYAIQENLNEFTEICVKAEKIWQKKSSEYTTANDWWLNIQSILSTDRTKHLIDAGLLLRMVPSLWLPKILDHNIDERLKSVIGAWAIAIVCEQWEKRIESCYGRPELQAVRDKEIANEPHVNWMPCDRPEWLLFEIEQNLTIRRIQVEVAMRMIEPPEMEDTYAKHSVMQLNMGEGKTAVIVPILASILGDGKQTCQITVLKSLYSTNLNSLRQYLGGFLNRRIYTFPCRRDALIGQHIGQMLDIYKECMVNKGVILTLPEYRLSFQLKMYEAIQKSDIGMAQGILGVLKWSNKNIRNILDESDAILQPKYQLVYTVGNQRPPDGVELRWTIAQAVLKRVPHHMKQLYDEYGKGHIEFDDNQHNEETTDEFTPCRILDGNMFELLKKRLIDDFLNGRLDIDFPEIISSKKDAIREVLMNKIVDKSSFEMIGSFLLNEQHTILILSGLLRFEVLKLILTKRWRVHYGINENGRRKMAVPFKAKDIAAEMTEFGHPDVAVCFTLLSYYYSGLSDAELIKVFGILDNDQNAKVIYEDWIRSIPADLIDPTIQSYDGINLNDIDQRDNLLFPLLQFNMYVIDFYLSNVVFRHEMKIFENKLICTAWDLCSDHFEHLVTGFSGTNDTKDILPMPIAQNDLPELENTNRQVRDWLLQPENQTYEHLPANVSGMEILERLIEHGIPVLLDAGALMLELTNKEVAKVWLKLSSSDQFDAALYFDSQDILQTINRNDTVTAFDCSVYREKLDRCLVYLDDVHTRGTDLKFPLNWKACVTLCGDITRDKTVQSCMRMRQLGKTHSISFWASYEADTRIRNLCGLSTQDQVKNEHVIEFICNNSMQFEQANVSHWTAAALNYTKKLTAHKLFEASNDENAMNELYRMCVDNEFIELSKMYGEKEEALLTDIAFAQFVKLALNPVLDDEIVPFIERIQCNVNDKLSSKAPNLKKFTHSLDEEQEKELEHELEQQRSNERPPDAQAVKPQFDKRLKHLVENGVVDDIVRDMKNRGDLLSMAVSLSHTQLYRLIKNDSAAWAKHILVTKDFKAVIFSMSASCDEFLRPVWWIAQFKNANGSDLVMLLSPYECNRLMPAFRTSKMAALFMYRPRLSKFHSNLLHNRALQVTGMNEPAHININDDIQIGVYSGSMYFASEAELNAFCGFLGLIPRPRSIELQMAFEQQIIEMNSFVRLENRRYSPAIQDRVGQCKFHNNPVDLVIELIKTNHQNFVKFSHAACILIRGIKPDELCADEPSSSLASSEEFEIVQKNEFENEHEQVREERETQEQQGEMGQAKEQLQEQENLNAVDVSTATDTNAADAANCQIQ